MSSLAWRANLSDQGGVARTSEMARRPESRSAPPSRAARRFTMMPARRGCARTPMASPASTRAFELVAVRTPRRRVVRASCGTERSSAGLT
jgi:hypothetical protein